MPRVLILCTTTGYQIRSFTKAAARLDIELVFATDRCQVLEDPWRDNAIPVKFYLENESLRKIVEVGVTDTIHGIIAVDDRPTVLASMVACELGLPGHSETATRASCNKLMMRRRLQAAGLLCPWFRFFPLDARSDEELPKTHFPCVVKPLTLSGSQGVIRANKVLEFQAALQRLRTFLKQPEIGALRDPANDTIMVEEFINGEEYALEGILEWGRLKVLALFDKPDPLNGPFFEETIYVTPSSLTGVAQDAMVRAVTEAAITLGLYHGPVHAECRINDRGVFVLEIAARPIGGLCSRVLRFIGIEKELVSLETLLLRHAVGESLAGYTREADASAVMMIRIPREGIYKRVEGLEQAKAISYIDQVFMTVKPDQHLIPLPEGRSYLGFIFSRAGSPEVAVEALRAAHQCLNFVIDPSIRVISKG